MFFSCQGNRRSFFARRLMSVSSSALLLGLISHQVTAEVLINIDIESKSLAEAFVELARETGTPVYAPGELVRGLKAPRVQGRMSSADAVNQLLVGTGLKAETDASGAIIISGQTQEQNSGADADHATAEVFVLEEIVVTAQKRETKLMDTPMSITAIGSRDIERKSLVSMQDYLTFVPGVTMQDMGVGQNQIVVRGLASGIFEQSAVTTYLGEIPLSNPLGGDGSADIKLVDMERIEVLKGPQGTLYGGGSLGGAVRNIPMAPNLEEFGGKVEVGYSHTAYSDSDNGNVVGVINIPLIKDSLALRVAAYRFENAGYVDLVSTDEIQALAETTGVPALVKKDNGGHTYTGVRASMLWQASDKLDITLMLADQHLEENGLSETSYRVEGYRNSVLRTVPDLPKEEGRDSDFKVVNLVANYDLEWATVISSTTLSEGGHQMIRNNSRLVPWAAVLLVTDTNDAFTQEIRLTSNSDGAFQYTIGGYYEDYDFTRKIELPWTGTEESLFNTFGVNDRNLLMLDTADGAEQVAVFGEIDYQFTEELKVSAGGRWFDYVRQIKTDTSGIFAGAPVDEDASESGSIFKVGFDYQPNDDVLLYTSWSQGFRIGNSIAEDALATANCDLDNDGLHDEFGLPLFSGARKSDKTNNYEVGGKFSFMDNRLIMSAAIYRIDWSNIPFIFYGACGSVAGSAAKARSQGVELETSYYATEALKIDIAASYTNAEYTEDLGVGSPITKGARLPLSARINGSLGVQYEFSFSDRDAFVRNDLSYVGSYITNPGLPLSGNYFRWDMRAGFTFDAFDLEVYGTNLGGVDTKINHFNPDGVWRVKPRTVGVTLRYHF